MALASHTPATWNDILSTTMHNYHKTLTDNIFNSRPLLNYLMSNGRVKTINGGISIVEPIIYTDGQADSYSEWDQVTVAPQATTTAAQFDWKQLVGTIAISGLEEAQNNGKEQIVNLLEAKIMQAEETLKTLLNGMLFGTARGTTSTNDFLSLQTLVDSTTAVGGIDPATEAWWASIETASERSMLPASKPLCVGATTCRPTRARIASMRSSPTLGLRVLRVDADPAGALHRHLEGQPRVPEPDVQERPDVLGLPGPRG